MNFKIFSLIALSSVFSLPVDVAQANQLTQTPDALPNAVPNPSEIQNAENFPPVPVDAKVVADLVAKLKGKIPGEVKEPVLKKGEEIKGKANANADTIIRS